jgi:hypothetical protein
MKNIRIYASVVFVVTVLTTLQSCKPEKRKLEPAPSQAEGLTMSAWTLFRVDQIDVNKQLAFVESDTLMEVSDVFIDGNPLEINFQSGGDFSLNTGSGSLLFPKLSGKWEFDNAEYPSSLVLEKGTPEESTITLLKPIRPRDLNLVLKFNKYCGGQRTVSYHLWFTRK